MKNKYLKKEIEKIFQSSNLQDKIFDNFRIAIDNNIRDLSLYNTLLWNKALSEDEILMYAEKISKEIPDFSQDIFLSVAKILDSASIYGNNKEKAFGYIKKAAAADKTSIEPYMAVTEIYSKEFDLPPFVDVVNFIEEGFKNIQEKSRLSFLLARLYGKIGDIEKGKNCQKRGEEYQRNGE
jgi:hypothetical protein